MKNPSKTHTGRMRGQMHADRAAVLWLTGMSDDQLSEFQFNTGMEWLGQYCGEDKAMREWLMRQPVIWAWWKNQWWIRDKATLPEMYTMYDDDGYTREWLENGLFLEEDEQVMIGPDGEIRVVPTYSDAEREIKKSDLLCHYRMVHQVIFIKHTPPYSLLGDGWQKEMRRVQKEGQIENQIDRQ